MTIKLSLVAKESLVPKINSKQSFFDYISPHFDLEDSNPFCLHVKVLHLMMMHHPTKFGYKHQYIIDIPTNEYGTFFNKRLLS